MLKFDHRNLFMLLFILLLTGASGCAPAVESPGVDATTGGCACDGGELLITELLINAPGEDDGLEYFEVLNVSAAPVDLEGLIAISGTAARPVIATVSGWLSASIAPGERAVFSMAPPGNGSTTVSLDALTLPNEEGTLTLMCGTSEVASVSWGTPIEPPPEGFALQLAPAADLTAPRKWCPSRDDADALEIHGSPGRPNHSCAGDSQCHDATTGGSRAIVRPTDGDIVITEVFSNPDGADTLELEWIEILALSEFDLGGLTVTHYNGPDDSSPSRVFTLPPDECFRVRIGEIVLLGGPDGIPLSGTGTLYNATGGSATITVSDAAGNVAAHAVHPKVPDGKSVSMKYASNPATAADADDRLDSWVVTTCRDAAAATPGRLETSCARKARKK